MRLNTSVEATRNGMNGITFRVVDEFPEPEFSALVEEAFSDYEESALLSEVSAEEAAARSGNTSASLDRTCCGMPVSSTPGRTRQARHHAHRGPGVPPSRPAWLDRKAARPTPA